MEYIVDCVEISANKLGRTEKTFETGSPKKAIEKFIQSYLSPIEEPEFKYGGLSYENNKFLSYKIKLLNRTDKTFFLNCKFLGVKEKYAKTLP